MVMKNLACFRHAVLCMRRSREQGQRVGDYAEWGLAKSCRLTTWRSGVGVGPACSLRTRCHILLVWYSCLKES